MSSHGTPRFVLHSCRTVRGTVELYVAAKWAWIEGLVRSRAPVIHRLSGLGSRVRPAPARGPPIRAVRLTIPLFNHSAPLHPSRVVNNDVQAYAQLYVTLQ